MKRLLFAFLLLFLSNIYAADIKLLHSYNANYKLFPENKYKEFYIKKLSKDFTVNYSVQSLYTIPKKEVKGYSCEEILHKLDQMGGLDKECYGVSYIDGDSGERKALFKKSSFTVCENNQNKGELYIKDKAAGGLYFDVSIDKYNIEENTCYVVYGILNRSPTNFFVRGIKKNQASIFVFMQEKSSEVKVYAIMQSQYSPASHRFLKSFVESAVSSRVTEIENWFFRMISTVK